MTVGELIAKLSTYPPESPVLVLYDGTSGIAPVCSIAGGSEVPWAPPGYLDAKTVYLDIDG